MDSKIIIGLGNPGSKYIWTRHNIGFLVVEYLAKKFDVSFQKSSLNKAYVAEVETENEKLILVLPQTYMNRSGQSVRSFFSKESAEEESAFDNCLIVLDDFHLDFGQLRLKSRGSHGGHNGLRSIEQSLQTRNYPRLRFGVGEPPSPDLISDYVLSDFFKEEKEILGTYIERAAEACLVWKDFGIEKAMEQFNRRMTHGTE